MAGLISDDPRRPANAALIFFALVGFFASVVTVIQFLQPKDASVLQVDLHPYEFRTPEHSAAALQRGEPARTVINDLRTAFCKDLDEDLIVRSSRAELAEIEKQNESELLSCKDFTEIEFAARWSAEFSTSDGEMLKYDIKNVGTKAAEDIRIRSDGLNAVQYKVGNDYINAEKDNSGEYYPLPELNPNEAVSVLAWTNSLPTNLSYSDWDDFPIITFAGSEVQTELLKPVPDGWYNFYDFVQDAPIVITIAFIVLASLIVLLIVWLVIAIPAALLTGRPLSEVFSDKEIKVIDPEKSTDVTS